MGAAFVKSWCGVVACCLGVGALGLGAANSAAAEEVPRFGDIPSDSLAVVSLDIAQLMEMHSLRYVPWEIASVACREQFGFELADVVSVDVTVSMPSPMPEMGVSIRLSKPFDIAALSDDIVSPVETAPKDESLRFRDILEAPMFRIAQREPDRVLVATQGTLRRMLSQRIQTGGPTISLVQQSQAPARWVVNMSRVRDLVIGFYDQSEETIPDSMRSDLRNLIERTDNAMLELIPSEEAQVRISFGASSAENAQSLLGSMDRLRDQGMRLAREAVAEQLEQDPSVSEAMKDAIVRYSDRMQTMIGEESFWSLNGDRVELNMENAMMANYSTIGVLTGMLLPAVREARDAARRASSGNNLKQLMLAMHNHHAAYQHFPDRVSRDSDGTPLLSWRVRILPFLDETELYQEFHLDEPWDSPHNIELLERMPAVFQSPSAETPPGHTVYLAPYGEDIGWPEGRLRISSIIDGTSNTIALVEAGPEWAVPWTQPEDLDLDQFPDGSWMPDRGTNIAMFDGSVRRIAFDITSEVLRALFTKDGGEPISPP